MGEFVRCGADFCRDGVEHAPRITDSGWKMEDRKSHPGPLGCNQAPAPNPGGNSGLEFRLQAVGHACFALAA
jgi:hypothetical protein